MLLIFLPTSVIAATMGVWLFYVQHQFEETHWAKQPEWQLHDAALEGHRIMCCRPAALDAGNIGMHHVHHLYSRIPFYRLPEVLRDHRSLAEAQRLTILESLACVKLNLWDERAQRLVSFRDARRAYAVN